MVHSTRTNVLQSKKCVPSGQVPSSVPSSKSGRNPIHPSESIANIDSGVQLYLIRAVWVHSKRHTRPAPPQHHHHSGGGSTFVALITSVYLQRFLSLESQIWHADLEVFCIQRSQRCHCHPHLSALPSNYSLDMFLTFSSTWYWIIRMMKI